MRCFAKIAQVLSLFACLCGLLAFHGIGWAQSSNTWTSVGPMDQERTGAAAVALSDGRVLITGGTDANGIALSSAELFDPATDTFSAAPSMQQARARHAAILLSTGDVLVTGGLTSGGGLSDSAEVFNSSTQQWTLLEATLGQGLSGHAMASLADGNILIAGGSSTAGPVNALLLYNATTQSITPIGQLQAPRTGAVAAATPDGRVLIAGGSDSSGTPLATTEIFVYDYTNLTGTDSAGPSMSVARTGATATTTYDGVAIIGGNNGQADLGSAEIFSQWTNKFRAVNGGTPRSGHFAILLPANGAILAMGGTGGTAVDMLQPWANDRAGAFVAAANSLGNQDGGFAAPAGLGWLMAGGGQGDAATFAELYDFPTISTNQKDYPPGTPVVMLGTGFKPMEAVDLHLHEWVNQSTVDIPEYTTNAGIDGSFNFVGYAPTPADLGARYHLTAVGESSGLQAQTIFTDSAADNIGFASSGLPSGTSVSVSYSGTNNGGNAITGNQAFAAPGPSTTVGTKDGTNFSYTFPSSVTATGGAVFNLTGTAVSPLASSCTPVSGNTSCFVTNNSATVTGTYVAATVSTTITTSSPTVTYKNNATSTVTVTANSGSATPTGAVTMSVSGTGNSASCTALSGSGTTATSTCTITYTGVTGSPFALTPTYTPGIGFTVGTTAGGTLTVNKAAITVTANPASMTYGGSVRTLTAAITGTGATQAATDGITGTATTTATSTSPVSGSPYTITAGTSDPNNKLGNYTVTLANGQLTVNKANATVVVTPYTVTYDGHSHTAGVTSITGVNGEAGATVGTVDVSNTAHTAAGTYASDSWSFTGTGNYNNIAATTITDTINKANATVVVAPYTVTYDGQPHTATVTSITGVNGETGATVGTVDLSNTTHAAAGTYSSDSWIFTGTANYNNIAATTVTDTINKANATFTVTPYSVTYDGQAHTAGVSTITGVNGETGSTVGTVNLSNTTHTAAGTYSTDSWSFSATANYNSISPKTIIDTISKADATVVVAPYTVTYDGQPHTASVASITGVNGEAGATVGTVNLSNTTHVASGNYTTDSWTFTGTGNYNNIAATTINDTINKATASFTVTPYTVTYDGQPHTASVSTINGVNGETGATVGTVTLNSTHTNAGTYSSDSWSFTGGANYNNIAATTITDTIGKANATVVVTPYSVTYNGLPHTAAVTSITGVNGETGAAVGTVDVNNTSHSAAGTYSADFWTFTGAANYNDIAATTITDTISKANATVVVMPYTVTYDGAAHTAAVASITGVYGETGATVGAVDVSHTTHTGAGTYPADFWTFAGTANYNSIPATTITDTINQAMAVISVTGYSVTYDGSPHSAFGTATGVGGENLNGDLNLGGTVHTTAASYSDTWTFHDPIGNYSDASGGVNDVISAATPVIAWSNPATITYGTVLSGTQLNATTTVPGTFTYTPAAGTLLASGNGQTLKVDFAPTDAVDYTAAEGTVQIDVNPATPQIVWPNPAGISYGTALSAAQLNALALPPSNALTGLVTADGSPNDSITGSNGTVLGGMTYVAGPGGGADQAFSLDGTGSVSIAYSAGYDLNAPGFATGFWMQGSPNGGGQETLLDKSYDAVAGTGWSLRVNGTTGIATFVIGEGSGNSAQVVSTANVLDGNWHYVAGSWDNGSGSMSLYVDGALQNTAAVTAPANNANGLTFGNNAALSSGFQGALDEINIFRVALPAGSYAYTPASGTVLNAGSAQPLSVAFTPADTTNFSAASGSASINVTKAAATITVTPYTVTYDGQPHTARATITGANGETGATVGTVDLSNTTHTNAGAFPSDSWSFTGTANYQDIPATTITDIIHKANATVTVNPYTVTYDGTAHTAGVASVHGVNGESDATVGTVDVSHTTHTDAGTYTTDYWTFTGAANYNDIAPTTITDTIHKADATVVIAPYTVTYDGHSHTASITTLTGVNGESGATVGTVDVSHTTHTNASSYASDYWTFTGAANYNDIAATTITDTINKADATVVVTPYSVTYDGHSHTATATITGVNGEVGGATVGTVNLSTTHTNAGTYASDSWSFTGAANYNDIVATTITDIISKANAAVVVTPYSTTYDGNAHTATVASITGVNGETGATVGTVNLSTTHTNAGTYASDSWSFTGAANYIDIVATTITDTISKANATVVVTPYTTTYDGNAHTATVASISGVKGETGATVGTVNLSTTHTNAGTYAGDSWSFTGAANYNDIAATTITDTINKAKATVVVTPYTVTYDAAAHTAGVTSITGVNGEIDATVGTVTLNTTHTNAGTYSGDSWSFTGASNYNDIAATSITDIINKANATINVIPYGVTYDGDSHTAAGTATGVKSENLSGLSLSGTTHTNAGTYNNDPWTFTDTTGNYNDAGGTVNDAISRANATITVTPYTVTYDATAHTATGTATGVKGEALAGLSLTGTTHTDAGTYANDGWTFTDISGNYNNTSGTVNDAIGKADANISVAPYTTTYDGHPHTATGTATGVGGINLMADLSLASTTHTSAGTYSDTWTFTDPAGNYNNIPATTITDTIGKANAAIVVTPYTVTYDGQSHTATVTSISGVNGETGATVGMVDVSNTTHIPAGTYASDHWTFTGAANYNNIGSTSITDTINKASVTVTFSNVGPFTYTGGAQTPMFVVKGVNSDVLTSSATLTYTGTGSTTYSGSTAPINAGTYVETVAFAGNANYNALNPSATQAFTIGFGFLGLQAPYAPPPTTFNVTRTMPLAWQYTNASGAVVNSAGANPQVQIQGPYTCNTTDSASDITVTSAGASGYQYSSTTNTWQFNWQIKGNAPGCYDIYILNGQTGQRVGPFPISVVSH